MKKTILTLAVIASSSTTFLMAQQVADAGHALEQVADSNWTYEASGSLTFSQLGLSNWAEGGENNLSLIGFINAKANYKKDKTTWDNSLRLGYGLLKQGETDFVKSDDIIDFQSKYGHQAKKIWYYSALLNFKTQFDLGYEKPLERTNLASQFFAPAYVNLALGMDYKPSDNFSVLMSPLSMKATYVLAEQIDETRWGLDSNETSRYEIGASLNAEYKTKLMENVSYETRLGLFSNYLNNPLNIDVNWENVIKMNVNKYISVNIITELRYDDDIVFEKDNGKQGKAVQFKEFVGIGLTYKFL
ncbi:MAG: DUF3078 domain-containing protein [Flavobacteriales bacterium]